MPSIPSIPHDRSPKSPSRFIYCESLGAGASPVSRQSESSGISPVFYTDNYLPHRRSLTSSPFESNSLYDSYELLPADRTLPFMDPLCPDSIQPPRALTDLRSPVFTGINDELQILSDDYDSGSCTPESLSFMG
ncbi:hypothetical protein ADEAN_000418800 [Angomonas deanei]|uniref:Uncharacterized protein n=1 Tax=Angomonas deanei TaxID=59799 RepID=A0A7G2CCP6_9TRYP|nr:hypothetical protein ADEAN_000418800 [Angomonas deanei]